MLHAGYACAVEFSQAHFNEQHACHSTCCDRSTHHLLDRRPGPVPILERSCILGVVGLKLRLPCHAAFRDQRQVKRNSGMSMQQHREHQRQ